MNNIIRKIDIKGFRSFDSVSLECGKVNVFSGTNDSGKSNILRALNLFFNSQTDFQTKLKFHEDYNKVSLARAIRSSKMKQQIKIRIYFEFPESYRTMANESDVFVERAFDRNGRMTEKISHAHEPKRFQINRLLNRIQYIYIPALKGENVLQYILGLIGEYELIEQGAIESLNQQINKKTEDLAKILNESKIPIGTSFGLPVLLSDFWQKLSVDTQFEKFDFIDMNIKSKKDEKKSLNPALFKIPLNSRGEGIKSKYIPPLLLWLKENNPQYIYIWGIDEPENSLEFGLASELSELYYNKYAIETQIFLTSHSLAFINPPENIKSTPKVFRCFKAPNGTSQIKSLDDLFKEQDKFDLLTEIGVLEIQKEVIENYRRIEAEREIISKKIDSLEKELKDLNTPVILTEGKTDAQILKTAWKKIYPRTDLPFKMVPSGPQILEDERTGGAKELKRILEATANLEDNKTIIGLFDNDKEGNDQFDGLKESIFEESPLEKGLKKHKERNVYGMLLPVPSFREKFVTKDCRKHRYLELEHYFADEVLNKYKLMGSKILGTEVFEINKGRPKAAFASEKAKTLKKNDFSNFKLLFDEITKVINGDIA